jgi:hypothetical protein
MLVWSSSKQPKSISVHADSLSWWSSVTMHAGAADKFWGTRVKTTLLALHDFGVPDPGKTVSQARPTNWVLYGVGILERQEYE